MFDVQRPKPMCTAVIRAASSYELSEYERNKLAGIEERAQENKIEFISVNGRRLPIDSANKEVDIELGNMAMQDEVTPELFSTDTFLIQCELPSESNEDAT